MGKSYITGQFSMAMLNHRRVYIYIYIKHNSHLNSYESTDLRFRGIIYICIYIEIVYPNASQCIMIRYTVPISPGAQVLVKFWQFLGAEVLRPFLWPFLALRFRFLPEYGSSAFFKHGWMEKSHYKWRFIAGNIIQWIGLRENLQENPIFNGKK